MKEQKHAFIQLNTHTEPLIVGEPLMMAWLFI